MITLLVAYGHSVFATPGLFRATIAFGAWGPALAVFVLATTLVGLALEFRASRKLRVMRIAGALLCATLLTLAATVSAEAEPALAPAWAEAILVGAVVAPLADDARRAQRRRRSATTSRRGAPSAPRRRSTA